MEIEFRLPGPDDPFASPEPQPEELGPDDLGNTGLLRAGLEEQGKQLRAEFAELDAARLKAEEEIELERAGVDLTLEGVRLAVLPDDENGAQGSDPLGAFAAFAKQRIAALPEGAREDAALHAGRERLRLDRAWRERRHNALVQRLQAGVDQSLEALTAQAAREPERLAQLAERGFGLLQATSEGLRFDETQNETVRGRFGRSLAEAALRAMAPKQALATLESGAIESLLPDDATRETLRDELTAGVASERRALKAETVGLMTLHLARLDRGDPGLPDIERDVELDLGADEARAFEEQAEAARQRHRLRQQWRLAPDAEIADGLLGAETKGDAKTARTVAEEIRAERRRDPAAAVAEDPKLQALLDGAEDDPAQRELATGVSLELQQELGIPERDRRVLTQQQLADLTAQIEAAPPAQRAVLLQQVRESYGAHYERVLSELDDARLDPTTLALARRLDDPLAVRWLVRALNRPSADLTEGLDPADVQEIMARARAGASPGLAPVFARIALDRYRQSQDIDDAVGVASETLETGDTGGFGEIDSLSPQETSSEDLENLLATADVPLDAITEAELRRQLGEDSDSFLEGETASGAAIEETTSFERDLSSVLEVAPSIGDPASANAFAGQLKLAIDALENGNEQAADEALEAALAVLQGGAGDDELNEDDAEALHRQRGRDLSAAFDAVVLREPLERAVADLEAAQERARRGEPAFPDAEDEDVRIGDSLLDAPTAKLLAEALTVQPEGLDAFRAKVNAFRRTGAFTNAQISAFMRAARLSAEGGFLSDDLSDSGRRSRARDLLTALDKRMVVRQRFTDLMTQVVEGGAVSGSRPRFAGVGTVGRSGARGDADSLDEPATGIASAADAVRRLQEIRQSIAARIARRGQRLEAFPVTPGGDEAARVKAVAEAARKRKGQPAGTFDKSAVEVFKATDFPPRSPEENVRRGMAAVDLSLSSARRGEAGVIKNAMYRQDVGSITFLWGSPGNPRKRYRPGKGLSHIIAKHGIEVLNDVMDTIAMGRIVGRRRTGTTSEKVSIEHKGVLVALALFKHGEKETWLLTGFEVGRNTDRPFNLGEINRPIFFRR